MMARMIVAWVRMKETKELLGLFWAPTHLGLWWSVDEQVDPYECEYSLTNPRGGNLVFSNSFDTTKYTADTEKSEDDECVDDDHFIFDAAAGEGAMTDLYEPKWKSFLSGVEIYRIEDARIKRWSLSESTA